MVGSGKPRASFRAGPDGCAQGWLSRVFLGRLVQLPRPMWILFCIQIIIRGGDFVFPFLTLFLTRKLGLNGTAAGLWVMANVVSGLLGTMVAGKVSDHVGRKHVLVACMLGNCLFTGVCGLLQPSMLIPRILVAACFFQGSMKPLIAAMVMDLCPPALRKEGFSLSYLGVNLGVAVGPMLAGFLFEHHLPWTFFTNSLALVFAMTILLWLVPAPPLSGNGKAPTGSTESAVRAFLGRPALVAFGVISIFLNLAYAQTGFGLTLYTSGMFGVHGAPVFGFLMTCNATVVIFWTTFLTRITRRLSGPMVMGMGASLYTVGFAMMAFRLDLHLLVASTLIWSFGEVLLAINTGAFIAEQTPVALRGRFQSICETLASSGRVLSPVLFGAVIAGAGVHVAWLLISLVAFGCAVAFGLLHASSGIGVAGSQVDC